MTRTTITRTIDAPIDKVFQTVAEIDNFSKALPHIVHVDILSDIKSGVGLRFRETRLMGKRKATTELKVTEYEANNHVRLVADAGGTIWDTVFTVKPMDGQTNLTMVMDAKAYRFFSKLLNPLMKGMIQKAIEKDMDAVKSYCEQ